MSRLGIALRLAGVFVVLAVVALLVMSNAPSGTFPHQLVGRRAATSLYILLPDIAHPVSPLVQVQNAHPAKGGALYFVDVVERRASTLDAAFPSIHPHASFVPASEIVPPGTTSRAVVEAELRQMSMSQRIAAAVAERQLGYHVGIHPDGVLVDNVYGNVPAAAKVDPADVVVAADGKSTPTLADLHALVRTLTPGQVVDLRIRRGSQTLVERVKTVANPKDPQRALIGIQVEQAATLKLPIRVAIDSHGIGGPSAGLAFTLEVMKQLGANVTHGYKVAATGEIELDGTVTAIGGVEQKTWGVREAGADVFLVPVDQGNAKDARRFAGPLKIIPVRSLAQALHALATLPPKK